MAPKDQDDRDLPAPLALSEEDGLEDQIVGAIGYAAWDGDRNDREVMDRIFDGVYEVKRLHPGEIMSVQEGYLNHDCSTLGGNSGSAILDFQTGQAVALHYVVGAKKTHILIIQKLLDIEARARATQSWLFERTPDARGDQQRRSAP